MSWSFTTADCPCSLMSSLTPAQTGLPVHDYRPGPGPFSYELGTKVTVDEPTELVALRYYKSAGETGAHVGRVWSAVGSAAGPGELRERERLGLAAPGARHARSRSSRARSTRSRWG